MDPKLKQWRWRVFAATWFSYAGYYFGRKPFSIVKSDLREEMDWSLDDVGQLGFAYLLAYTLGQFASAFLGHRLGPRITVLVGMAISVGCNVVFGFTNSWWTFAAFLALNGLAQSTGWSGNVATMSAWFQRKERGRVMGFWATNFQVGGVVANAVAAWALGEWGFRWSFLTGSVLLLGVWAFFAFNQRNSPADVGLPPLEDPDAVELSPTPSGAQGSTQGAAPAAPAPSRPEAAQLPMAIAINIGLMGVFYFFIKFIRYAIWSWAPLLLKENYGIASDDAGYLSTTFDVCGIFGVIALGWISDKVFAGRRAKASFFFLLGMVASCVMLYVLGPASLVLFAVSLGLIGFCLYGPDAIMTSAGAMDVTGRWRGAAVAAGVINGMGSIGSMVQELLLPKVLKGQGVGAVFAVMLASSVCACLCLALLLWRNKRGQADI